MKNRPIVTVITYGTFDLFHIGHLNLLRRCHEIGGRVIVGVSTDEFNSRKGKKAVVPFSERIAIVSSIKFVDEVFEENDWEQKRDDIIRFGADVFAMGDDWVGKFDDLLDICQVKYLPRTSGVSSTKIRDAITVLQNVAASLER